MKFKGLLTDRQPLIAAIQERTGLTAVYAGAPSFRYYIGNYTVLRDHNAIYFLYLAYLYYIKSNHLA